MLNLQSIIYIFRVLIILSHRYIVPYVLLIILSHTTMHMTQLSYHTSTLFHVDYSPGHFRISKNFDLTFYCKVNFLSRTFKQQASSWPFDRHEHQSKQSGYLYKIFANQLTNLAVCATERFKAHTPCDVTYQLFYSAFPSCLKEPTAV